MPPIFEPFRFREKRAEIACTNCRSRKVKCRPLSLGPGCSECKRRDKDCVYKPVNPSSTTTAPVDSMGSVSPIVGREPESLSDMVPIEYSYDNHGASNQRAASYIVNPPVDMAVERSGMSPGGWSNAGALYSEDRVFPPNSTAGSAQIFRTQNEYKASTYDIYTPYHPYPQLGTPLIDAQSMIGPVASGSQGSAEAFEDQNHLLQYSEVDQFTLPTSDGYSTWDGCFCESCGFMIAEQAENLAEISASRLF